MKPLSKLHQEAITKAKTEDAKVKAAAKAMIETPMEMIEAILMKHEQAVIEVMRELHEAKEAAVRAERQRIVNLLMIQHEAAKGSHNYWKVAANLVKAEFVQDSDLSEKCVEKAEEIQHEWVGLTDEEIMDMYNEPRSDAEMITFGREVEAKLKEKNT